MTAYVRAFPSMRTQFLQINHKKLQLKLENDENSLNNFSIMGSLFSYHRNDISDDINN